MSKIILCTSRQAKTPFTFLNTKVEIYTYEELCFYIYNNSVLISRSALSEKLFNWIRDELGMDALSQKLYGLTNRAAENQQDILVAILSAGNYYTPEEIATYTAAWEKYQKLREPEKEKLKADGYLGYRRYIKAATMYDEIIRKADDTEDRVFLGNVYHNRAVAAANNLDTEDAKTFFRKAYQMNQNQESLKGYFYVVAATEDTATLRNEVRTMGLGENFFESIMEEIGNAKTDVREMTIFAMLQRAVFNRMNNDMTDYDKRMDIILGDLKDDFREQVV